MGETGPALILLTTAAVASAAAAALAWARYRATRDPHQLFSATAFLVLAVQLTSILVWRYRHPLELGRPVARWATDAWLLGWAVAGGCFLLGVPWWDRRGRPPTRAVVVVPVAIGLAAAGDLALLIADPWPSTARGLGPLGWALGLVAFGLLGITAVRELQPVTGRHGANPWLAAACGLAAALQLAALYRLTPGLSEAHVSDWIVPLVPAIAFAGLLMAQRAEATRMRRESDRAEEILGGRAEIASMIAHEVRGPVSSVRGLAATTLGSYDKLSDDERRELIGLVEQESRRLLNTVDQTSLALKVDAGTLRFAMRPDDVGGAAREGATAADPGRPIEIAAEPNLTARIDRRWISEIVRQLVDNAAKFSPAEGPIGVAVRRDDGHAVIEVTDAGPGIPPDKRDLVFTKFAKWRSPGYEEIPGSGLGLFICRALAAEHHGDVVIVDRPGGGTMLRIRLPLEA
jgi:signal transduction histidine kinase